MILWGYGAAASEQSLSLQAQSLLNLVANLALYIYLSVPWLERTLTSLYLLLAIIVYTGAVMFSNMIYIVDPTENLFTLLQRGWMLVPILLVPLVIIAWQYSLTAVILFTIFTNGIELAILYSVVKRLDFSTLPVLGLPLILAFAYGTVGFIVVQLMKTQRSQKRKLILANIRLGQQANTLESLAISRERNRLARELHDILADRKSVV